MELRNIDRNKYLGPTTSIANAPAEHASQSVGGPDDSTERASKSAGSPEEPASLVVIPEGNLLSPTQPQHPPTSTTPQGAISSEPSDPPSTTQPPIPNPLPGVILSEPSEPKDPQSPTPIQNSNHNSYNIPTPAIEAGIRNTQWPGRLELLPTDPPILLDVAHNPAGAWTLRAAIANLPPTQPRTLIFSCLRDKDLREMAQILLPLFDPTSGDPDRTRDHILFVPINNPRAATLDELQTMAQTLDIPAESAPTISAALQRARTLTPTDGIILATGSIYLIGELRSLLADEPRSL